MSDYILQLFSLKEYIEANEPICFTVYASSGAGTYALADITDDNTFIVNFNDFTTSNYIKTFSFSDFEYTYVTPLELATIQISATISGAVYTNSFEFLRIDSTKIKDPGNIIRPNPFTLLELPHKNIKIPTNDLGISQTFNKVIDKLFDNIEYIQNSSKTYKASPGQKINGWGTLKSYAPIECLEKSSTVYTNLSVYGVLGDSSIVTPLFQIPASSYIPGTSFVEIVSTIPLQEITTTVELSSFYCTNLENTTVHLLSTSDINLQDLPSTGTLTPFTHTIVDYETKNFTGENIVPVLTGYTAIKSCNSIRLIPMYSLSGAIIGTNYSYTPNTIEWKLRDKFYFTESITSTATGDRIQDLIVHNNDFYIARGSFIEKYKAKFANKEMSYTTKSIDISETFTLAKSVSISKDNNIYMLDSTRHKINVFKLDERTGTVTNINQWGSLGGADSKQSFYKPNQLFISNNKVFVCDTGNRVIKRYNINGNWEFTYTAKALESEQIVSACSDSKNNIYVLTKTGLFTFDIAGNLIQQTSISFSSDPVKIVLNLAENILYVCCKLQVYRITTSHKIIDQFADLVSSDFPTLTEYTSICLDDNYNVYLTDGYVILKYIDIPESLNIRNLISDKYFWSRADIYIAPDEFVSDWVYNRSLRRVAENIELLFRSIENKIRILSSSEYELEPLNDLDKGLYTGLPTSLSELSVIGLNEVVASEVINRTINQLQDNLQFLIDFINNKNTLNKSGFIQNFTEEPITLSNACWSWDNRSCDKIKTTWPETSVQNTTWAHAQNYNNVVVLSGTKITIPIKNSISLNNIENELTVSFWVSAQKINTEPTSNYFLFGIDNTYELNTGYAVNGKNGDFALNVNGNTDATTIGSVMNTVTANLTHIVFAKKDENCLIYVNGELNNTIGSAPQAAKKPTQQKTTASIDPLIPTPVPQIILDTFSFGSNLPAEDTMVGFLHDIWVFDKQLTQQDVITLYDKQISPALSSEARNATVSRWFGNSIYVWIDCIGNSNATVFTGPQIILKNFLGTCCE